MSHLISGMLGMPGKMSAALNLTPQGAAANILKNMGESMIGNLSSSLTHRLFSGWPNQQQGGGHAMRDQLMDQVLRFMGIMPHNNPFTMSSDQHEMHAFNQGMAKGIMEGISGLPLQNMLSLHHSRDFNQLGNIIGFQLANKAGLSALMDMSASSIKGADGALSGGGKVDGASPQIRAELGKFMDQHPEIFGNPTSSNGAENPKSWEDALKDGKPLSDASLKQFQIAKNDLQMVMTGGTISASHGSAPNISALVNADAQLYVSNIKQDALKLLS